MKRTKDEADRTRQALLDAALGVFSHAGYQAARLDDIAQAAQVTRGAIYHHFGSKAAFYTALVDDASAQGSALIARAVAEGGSFAAIATRILVYSWSMLEDDRRFRDVMELLLFKTGMAEELHALDLRRQSQASELVHSIAAMMAQGIAQGALRADLHPETAARAYLAYQQGIAQLWLANRAAFSLKAAAPALAAALVQGLAA